MKTLVLGLLFSGLSVLALICSPAAFTPAVFLSLVLLASCGLLAYLGYLRLAVCNIFINFLAVLLSPINEHGVLLNDMVISGIILFALIMACAGLLSGISSLRRTGA